MATFEQREKATEMGFAQERELMFRIAAHRNRLLARWAAVKMGLPAEHADGYAAAFASAEIAEHDVDVVVARLRDDFLNQGVVVTVAEIHSHLENFAKIAMRELFSDPS
jgi:hypothetical protein